MQKLPVLEIVRQSYRFLMEERWTIFRLSWFLVLVATALQVAFEYADIQQAIAAVEAGGGRSHADGYAAALLIGLIQALAISIVAVALHRVILFGDRKEGTSVYFALGKVEFLFLLLPLALMACLALVALAVLPSIAFLPSVYAGRSGTGTGAVIDTIVLYAVVAGPILGAFVVLTTRFMPVLPLAVIARSALFREAWQLTRGRFWRLFWRWFLGSLPLMILFGGADAFLGDPEEGLGLNAGREAILAALQEKRGVLPVRAAISFLSNLIGGAVGVGLLCYSFKALLGYAFDHLLAERLPPQ
jgi:hypothetical protein